MWASIVSGVANTWYYFIYNWIYYKLNKYEHIEWNTPSNITITYVLSVFYSLVQHAGLAHIFLLSKLSTYVRNISGSDFQKKQRYSENEFFKKFVYLAIFRKTAIFRKRVFQKIRLFSDFQIFSDFRSLSFSNEILCSTYVSDFRKRVFSKNSFVLAIFVKWAIFGIWVFEMKRLL